VLAFHFFLGLEVHALGGGVFIKSPPPPPHPALTLLSLYY